MEAMLADGNVIEKIMELKAKDSDLVAKIKQFFDNLLAKIRSVYKGLTPDSDEGKAVLEMKDSIKKIQQLFAEALMDASENFQAAEVQKNTTEDGGDISQSRRLSESDLDAYLKAGNRKNKNKLEAINRGIKIILTTKTEIINFINDAIGHKTDAVTVAYGKVNDRLADAVRQESNGKIVIDDNYLELIPDNLQHAYEQHSKAKETGDIDLSFEDFERIPEYLDTFTELLYAIRYSSGQVRICVSKKLENGRILIIETVSKSRGSIQFKNAIGVSEEKYNQEYLPMYKKGAATPARGNDSSNNSLRDSYDSKNNIHNDSEIVKRESFEAMDIEVDEKTESVAPAILKSERNNPYSYEALTSKPDMVVTTIDGNVPKNRADVVYQAKQNAAKVGKFDPETGSVSVYVDDVGVDVVLGAPGLKHGLEPRRTENAIVTLKAGEILKHSVKINELTPKKETVDGSYVLIGAAKGNDGAFYIVRSVVNQVSHKLISMDVLYAINAKKGNRLRSMRPGFQGPVTDSTISIADLLDLVNQYFPDILPEDVLKHYGYDARPDGDLGSDVLYQYRADESASNRSLLANAFESAAKDDMEKKKLREYREQIEHLDAEEQKLRDLNKQIKDLSFAKGKRDTKKISALRDEATKTANRIGIYDKRLLRLEASKPLQDVLELRISA